MMHVEMFEMSRHVNVSSLTSYFSRVCIEALGRGLKVKPLKDASIAGQSQPLWRSVLAYCTAAQWDERVKIRSGPLPFIPL